MCLHNLRLSSILHYSFHIHWYLFIFFFLVLKWYEVFNQSKEIEIPSQEPEIELQFPIEPIWIHDLETKPLNPFKHVPLIVCPFASVSFHSAFPSFDIYGQFITNLWFSFICFVFTYFIDSKKKKVKPFSQVGPPNPKKHSQLKFAFNLVEHCPPFKHLFDGQLASINFIFK